MAADVVLSLLILRKKKRSNFPTNDTVTDARIRNVMKKPRYACDTGAKVSDGLPDKFFESV